MSRRPTIIDVARRAGVSKSTAARALSKVGSITDEARERVVAAAAELGYERNDLAVGMRSGRTGLLGLIVPDISNPFWAEVARGAQDRAFRAGSSILVFSSDWQEAREAQHLRAVRRVRADGVIVNPISGPANSAALQGLPCVLIGSSAHLFPGIPSVGSDIGQAVAMGLDHLLSLGHDAPCLIVGPEWRVAMVKFREAVAEHCATRSVDPAQLRIEDGGYTAAGGYEAAKRLLAQKHIGHLSIFAANDLMALGALRAVREAGLRCPDDVSILGFDGIPAGDFSDPGLTTIEKPGRAIGERAVEMLLAEIEHGHREERVYLPCRLVARGSIADRVREDRRQQAAG